MCIQHWVKVASSGVASTAGGALRRATSDDKDCGPAMLRSPDLNPSDADSWDCWRRLEYVNPGVGMDLPSAWVTYEVLVHFIIYKGSRGQIMRSGSNPLRIIFISSGWAFSVTMFSLVFSVLRQVSGAWQLTASYFWSSVPSGVNSTLVLPKQFLRYLYCGEPGVENWSWEQGK